MIKMILSFKKRYTTFFNIMKSTSPTYRHEHLATLYVSRIKPLTTHGITTTPVVKNWPTRMPPRTERTPT